MATIPTLTETLDDEFTESWYEIRENAIDNILDATVFWLAIREFGSMTTQVGGRFIERTVRYGTKSKQNITKGSVLQQEVKDLETVALWNWGYSLVDVNRSFVDDQINSGPDMIKSYITKRLGAARDAAVQDTESDLFFWASCAANQMQGIWDLVTVTDAMSCTSAGALPITISYSTNGTDAFSSRQTSGVNGAGTNVPFGNINSASGQHTWWRSNNKVGTPSYTINLLPDMRNFWNTVGANVKNPNFLICDQLLYETYEDEVGNKQQIVRTSFNKTAADLGFEVTTFKGAPLTWTAKMASSSKMLFLDMDDIELVYDPQWWFDLTEWFTTPNQLERVAYLILTMQLICSQRRRHGLLDYDTTTNA